MIQIAHERRCLFPFLARQTCASRYNRDGTLADYMSTQHHNRMQNTPHKALTRCQNAPSPLFHAITSRRERHTSARKVCLRKIVHRQTSCLPFPGSEEKISVIHFPASSSLRTPLCLDDVSGLKFSSCFVCLCASAQVFSTITSFWVSGFSVLLTSFPSPLPSYFFSIMPTGK